jgi:SsrA-binding protein
MAGKERKPESRDRVIATNRVARRDYDIIDEMECGLVLRGSEVKSLREARARLNEAFARVVRGELWLVGLHIPPYSHGVGFGAHDPDRHRKLLAHRHEIERWGALAEQQRLTMVPLSMYFKDGRVKVELGLGRGRKHYDKRQALARRDAELETRRAAAAAAKGRAS